MRRFVLAALLLVPLVWPRGAPAESQRVYVDEIPDRESFERYSRVLGSDRFSKFVIDIESNDIYFIDVNVFNLHADFVLGVLLDQEWTAKNIREYNKNYGRDKPHFILGYVTEHLKVDRFTFSFWEGDRISPAGVARVRKKLQKTFFKKDIAFRPDSPRQERVARRVARRGIETVTNDAIYKQSRYQAFNKGEAVGTLKVVPEGTPYHELTFNRTDIVLLQEIYPDISPVAGILSSEFSTPLAHVNLRATAWGIPNAGHVNAAEKYKRLDGRVVYFEVKDAGMTLRRATAEEIARLEEREKNRRQVEIPPADLESADLPMLTHIDASEAETYGAKTANLGEIASSGLPGVHVPPGFGVPFFYYRRHLRQNGIARKLEDLLDSPRFESDARWRKQELAKIREGIRQAPLDPDVLDALYKRIRIKLDGGGVFVRSSTNAEDLEGFNGAGLYDTVPNVRGKEALGAAVKRVWASLWNHRAVEERSHFGIAHRDVYAGVLIQAGVDATAAGVLITANLFNPQDDDSYTINAKWGLGIRVVQGKEIPEQVIFDTSNDGTKIISRSDDPVMLRFDEEGGIKELPVEKEEVILTEERAKELAEAVQSFVPLFATERPLDVEWVFEGDKVWIVQARPYITSRR